MCGTVVVTVSATLAVCGAVTFAVTVTVPLTGYVTFAVTVTVTPLLSRLPFAILMPLQLPLFVPFVLL